MCKWVSIRCPEGISCRHYQERRFQTLKSRIQVLKSSEVEGSPAASGFFFPEKIYSWVFHGAFKSYFIFQSKEHKEKGISLMKPFSEIISVSWSLSTLTISKKFSLYVFSVCLSQCLEGSLMCVVVCVCVLDWKITQERFERSEL